MAGAQATAGAHRDGAQLTIATFELVEHGVGSRRSRPIGADRTANERTGRHVLHTS
jgi:hypothetical protein